MLQLEVRELGGDDLCAWDTLVAGSAQGAVFHSSNWLVKNASLQSQDLVPLGCYEGEELIGGCPLYLSRPYNLLGPATSTAALTPYGGMIVTEIEGAKQRRREAHANRIITALLEYIAWQEFDCVNLVNSLGLTNIRAFVQRGMEHDDLLHLSTPAGGQHPQDSLKGCATEYTQGPEAGHPIDQEI